MSENYHKLINRLSSLNTIKNYLDSGVKWERHYDSDMIQVSIQSLMNDIVLKTLSDRFRLMPFIIRFDAKKWHQWHTDAVRNVALNVVIHGNSSHTVFGNKADSGHYYGIDELIYDTDSAYLLDVSKPHSILNLGEPRIIFTIGFAQPTLFADVRTFCIENNL
jgi:hypothetical protein